MFTHHSPSWGQMSNAIDRLTWHILIEMKKRFKQRTLRPLEINQSHQSLLQTRVSLEEFLSPIGDYYGSNVGDQPSEAAYLVT